MVKRNLLSYMGMFAICFSLLGCAKDISMEDYETEKVSGLILQPVKTGYDRALQTALTAPAEVYGKRLTLTKSGVPEVIPGEPIMNPRAGAMRANIVDSAEKVQDTLIYVFTYSNDEGYMLIATDEWGSETMAFGDSGNFNVRDTADNPLASFLVNSMIDYLLYNDEPSYKELTPQEI